MLGVGWTEMLVIGLVALIVIGPKELPTVMRKLGRFTATIRRMGNDFQRELNKTTGLDEVKNLRNAITQPLKQTTDAIRKEFNTVTASGTVEPSGVLKPADPNSESVVDEIRAAAGMTPAESIKAAVTKASTITPVAGATRVKAAAVPAEGAAPAKPAGAPAARKRVTRAKAAPTAKVETAELPAPQPAPGPVTKPAAKPTAKPAAKPAAEPPARAGRADTQAATAKPARKKAAQARTTGAAAKPAVKKA
ncbi:Sec-independent protein translocase protein TatB [Devosia sp.]|uniref:Sec-independent protein translocase protein TatB n=1 Tax=Devosia sp. TaxID=1871048 RepID=UPI002F069692